MAIKIVDPAGSTPITDEQLDGLKRNYRYISVQSELDAAEQQVISEGFDWALRSRKLNTHAELLRDETVRLLHKKMFGKMYAWAGEYRLKEVAPIGIDPLQIAVQTRILCDNAKAWVDSGVSPPDVAIRLHHRLVAIHPFPNGNGRHARLMADLLLIKHYVIDALPWGGGDLRSEGAPRTRYHAALVEADKGDFAPLLQFASTKGHT